MAPKAVLMCHLLCDMGQLQQMLAWACPKLATGSAKNSPLQASVFLGKLGGGTKKASSEVLWLHTTRS